MSKIVKKLVLPSNGEVFVKKGEHISPGTSIAKTLYLRERPFIIDIARPLKVELNEINDYLKTNSYKEYSFKDKLDSFFDYLHLTSQYKIKFANI